VLKASVAATEREEALTELSQVRQRHVDDVEKAWAEAVLSSAQSVGAVALGLKAWDHSAAKARLT
jgi:hypothetical protein